MAADPIAAAEQLAGQTYATAADRTTAGKKALLDQLSTQGTYQNTINQAATQAAAPQPVAPHPGDASAAPQLAAMSTAGTQQVQMANQAALAAAATLAAHQAAAQQAAAGTYFDQVKAAIPIEQSRSTSQAQQIMADLIAQREAQAAAKEQARISLQIQQEQLAGARESRAAAATKSANPALNFDDRAAMEDRALSSALPSSAQYVVNKSGQQVLSPVAEAVQAVATDPTMDLKQVYQQFGITDRAQQDLVVQALNRYQGTLSGYGYYGAGQSFGHTYVNPISSQDYLTDMLTGGGNGGGTQPSKGKVAKAPAKSTSKAKPTKAKSKTPIYDSMGHIIGYN